MSADEIRLIKRWTVDEELLPSEIAQRLGRDKSTITRFLGNKGKRKVRRGQQKGRRGPARLLTDAQVEALEEKLKDMIKKAKGRYEVTALMLKKSGRVKVSVRVMMERLHERGVYFFAMHVKPDLTDDDIKDRCAFAERFVERPRGWWALHIDMVIDVKFFPVYLNGKARRHAAQSGTRGVYRIRGQAVTEGYYKPNPKLKYNTGAKGVHVLAGVGNGKVLLWEYIEGRWNGSEAERIYSGPMLKALQTAHPEKTRYRVLEDNDPAFQCTKAALAKERCKIDKFEIPRHSPQLNLCDYWLWKQVTRQMRKAELKWPEDRKEDRSAYLRRLKHTAQILSVEEVNNAFGSMKRRCQRLLEATPKGGQIEG